MLTCNSKLTLKDGQILYNKTRVEKGTTVDEMNDAVVKSVFSSLQNEAIFTRGDPSTVQFTFAGVDEGKDLQFITITIEESVDSDMKTSDIVTEYAIPALIDNINSSSICTQVEEEILEDD